MAIFTAMYANTLLSIGILVLKIIFTLPIAGFAFAFNAVNCMLVYQSSNIDRLDMYGNLNVEIFTALLVIFLNLTIISKLFKHLWGK